MIEIEMNQAGKGSENVGNVHCSSGGAGIRQLPISLFWYLDMSGLWVAFCTVRSIQPLQVKEQ